MKENQWFQELTEMAKHDTAYQQCLEQARLLEPEFRSIRGSLRKR